MPSSSASTVMLIVYVARLMATGVAVITLAVPSDGRPQVPNAVRWTPIPNGMGEPALAAVTVASVRLPSLSLIV